ncbi:MAG: type II secretion system F family protein [Verrucomicrobiae bacterium]|nr:type II secretion system F family protein [Verrucomicrobiae bacterium]
MPATLVAITAVAAVVLALVGLARLFEGGTQRLRRRIGVLAERNRGLTPSERPFAPASPAAPLRLGIGRLVTWARGRAWEQRMADLLAGADVPLWPGEFATLRLAVAALGALAGLVLLETYLAAGILAVAGYGIPTLLLHLRKRKRLSKFEQQLPHMLQMLVSSLRSGASLNRSLEVAAQMSRPPMSKDLAIVLRETSLGIPLEESLDSMARRVGCPDFETVVVGYQIQRESGGSLTAVLSKVAEAVRLRLQLRGELRALTAQGRFSALIISLLPVAVGVVLKVASPSYLEPLFEDWSGRALLLGALVWQTIGALIIWKIVNIKI